MYPYTLPELVNAALLSAGCDPARISPLDPHATVQIDLHNAPAIFVGSNEGSVVIWSDLCEFHPSIVQLRAGPLLHEIRSGFPHSASGKLSLRESEGQLQLYVDLTSECQQDPEHMAEALNAFFESQWRMLEIVRQ